MKTFKNLFEKICSFQNLCLAFQKARKGKNNSSEVLLFNYNLEGNLVKLQKELQTQTYKTGKYRNFIIFEPKKREISALPFKDRIVHHAVCNVIEPIFEKTFINESYACRKNKGTHAGADKLQAFLRKNPKGVFALKCDVKRYFPSIDCKLLKQELRKKISCKKTLNLLDLIVEGYGKETGIPIGNLTSQLFANIFLNKLDYFAKHELKAKYYVRYMDDFVILHSQKKQLQLWKQEIREFLNLIKLELSEKKANVFPAWRGVDFLGYKIFAFYKLARKSTVKRFLHKIKAKIKNQTCGKTGFEKLSESFNSWEAYLEHASAFGLKKSIYGGCFKNAF